MTTDAPNTAILFAAVHASYGRRPALEDVSFQVDEGAFAALIGPNGAGKSTCLRLLLGLVQPSSGTVEVFGKAPGRSSGAIGYVPQGVQMPRGFPISALDVALMGRTGLLGPGRRPRSADREIAMGALEQVGLADADTRRFQDLSGGQQQRVLIARALAGKPRMLLLDEPTAGLDTGARARFYALVCDLQHAGGLTLLCATHDLDVVGDHADQLILLDRTVKAQGTPAAVLGSGALRTAYPFPEAHVHAASEHGN